LQKEKFFICCARAETKYEYSYSEKKFLKKHLSSVEFSFNEPNIEDIHAVPYLPLVTSSSTKRGLAMNSLLWTYTGYTHWWFIFCGEWKHTLLYYCSIFRIDLWNNVSFWFTFKYI